MAEIANGLGADGLVLVDLARLGEAIRVNVKVISAANGRVLATQSVRVSREDEVPQALSKVATATSCSTCWMNAPTIIISRGNPSAGALRGAI